MSTLCLNHWEITGPAETLVSALKLFTELEGGKMIVTFDKAIPMPDIIRKIHVGAVTLNCKRTTRWIEERDRHGRTTQRELTEEEKAEARATGFHSWQDWTDKNWGTKWNAHKSEVWCSEDKAMFSFITAGEPPNPVIKHFRKRFPDLKLRCTSLDESITTSPYTSDEIDASWFAGEEARKLASEQAKEPAAVAPVQPGIVEAAP